MEKQKKINLLALVLACLALSLQFLGVYGSTATQSSLSVGMFWAFQAPVGILFIVYLASRFKKERDLLYYIVLGGLFLSLLLPFFNTLRLIGRYPYEAVINLVLNLIVGTIPYLLLGAYFITKRRLPWLFHIAFGLFMIKFFWALFFYCKEWVPSLVEYIAFQNNEKFTAGFLNENPLQQIRFYGALTATAFGQCLLYSALWLSIPKADKNIVKI